MKDVDIVTKYQLFDPLTSDEFAALKADIAERGVIVPVELDEQGNILDGHHRLKAWQELKDDGVPVLDYPRVVRAGLTEPQKRNHVRSLNIIRRQLTTEQHAAQMAAMRADGMSYRDISDNTGIPKSTIYDALNCPNSDSSQPERITGKDNKSRPATKKRKKKTSPRPPGAAPLSLFAESEGAEEKAKAKAQKKLASDNGATGEKIEVHFQSEKEEYGTPHHIIDRAIAAMGAVDLDPCSNWFGPPNVPAATHYTQHDDGLSKAWAGRVYMNPPYGREIIEWVAKLVDEYAAGAVTEAVALVPARTDTKWFRLLRDYPRCFINGRLQFIGANESAPFPSMAVYLGLNVGAFVVAFSDIGDVYSRIGVECECRE